jgi:hypothetical protein
LLTHGVAIEGQRGDRIGAVAEHHESDPVANAPLQEVADHGLDRGKAIDDASAQAHVGLPHAAGQIDHQHQIAAAARRLHGIVKGLRTRRCDAQ